MRWMQRIPQQGGALPHALPHDTRTHTGHALRWSGDILGISPGFIDRYGSCTHTQGTHCVPQGICILGTTPGFIRKLGMEHSADATEYCSREDFPTPTTRTQHRGHIEVVRGHAGYIPRVSKLDTDHAVGKTDVAEAARTSSHA